MFEYGRGRAQAGVIAARRHGTLGPAWPRRLRGGRPSGDGQASARSGQALRSRAARFSALITPRSDAFTIDSLMPTPHSTRSPTSISR
jgi:hypothetical protein